MPNGRFAHIFAKMFLLASAASLASHTALAQTVPAVEYYYAAWDDYFITAFPDEIALLDGGAFGGVWKRTGETFNVWPTATATASPACRFFSTSFSPKSSHFYTPFATECDTVKGNPDWQFESIAFYIQQAAADGTCGAGTVPLYRLYNNGMGGAPNHRYTTSLTVFNTMAAAGWVSEGNGDTKVFACVPSAPGAKAAEGLWRGTAPNNRTFFAIVLNEGTYYIAYSLPGAASFAGVASFSGVVHGSGNAADGVFTSSDARDFALRLGGFGFASTVSVTYDAAYGKPASLSALSGSYNGLSGHLDDAGSTMTASIDSNGVISAGNPGGCQFSGTATPRASVNVFDLAIQADSGPCLGGPGLRQYGILYYDEAARQFYAFIPFNSGRPDMQFLVGAKSGLSTR